MTANAPVPAWYRDPAGIDDVRYWDGTAWTNHAHSYRASESAPEPASAPEPVSAEPSAPEPSAPAVTPQVLPQLRFERSASATAAATAVPRRPLALHLAWLCWAIAGVVSVLVPFVMVNLIRGQYDSYTSGGSAESFWDGVEGAAGEISGPVLNMIVIAYVAFALVALVVYALIVGGVIAGRTGARVFGTVLAIVSVPCLLLLAAAQAHLQAAVWFRVSAIGFANTCVGLVLALHVLGTVLVWMPSVSEFARSRQYDRVVGRGPKGVRA